VDVFLLGRRGRRGHEVRGRPEHHHVSSCGLCGRVTIESLRQRRGTPGDRLADDSAAASPAARVGCVRTQRLFDETGGLHGAGLFTLDGEPGVVAAEDVGRHNAVDKVIGRMLIAERLPARPACARRQRPRIVRDRAEGVDGRHPGRLCRVGAVEPGDRARDEAGITLGGFVRDGGFNLYAHTRRIAAV
jgi:FdhD protein